MLFGHQVRFRDMGLRAPGMYTGVSGFRDLGFGGCRAVECPESPIRVWGLGFREYAAAGY